jgi:hypothetical protein
VCLALGAYFASTDMITIGSIMLFDSKTKVVRVNDSYATRKHFRCLLDPEAFVESDLSFIQNLLFFIYVSMKIINVLYVC